MSCKIIRGDGGLKKLKIHSASPDQLSGGSQDQLHKIEKQAFEQGYREGERIGKQMGERMIETTVKRYGASIIRSLICLPMRSPSRYPCSNASANRWASG